MKQSILQTLIYSDLFDFPLTLPEIHRYLIIDQQRENNILNIRSDVDYVVVEKETKELARQGKIEKWQDFYFLPGRKKIVQKRTKRVNFSKEKLKKAKRVANLLKIIPTIKMVAVTGAVAALNAKKEDDIDFLIVTQRGFIWLTRFLTTAILSIMKIRRKPSELNIKDKICLNLFLEESCLAWPKKERNLFIASEIVHLKPLLVRDNCYQRFLWENQWAGDFLPNAIKIQNYNSKFKIFLLLEKLSKELQLQYMAERRTKEKIEEGRICFHPEDKTTEVLKKYRLALRLKIQNPKS